MIAKQTRNNKIEISKLAKEKIKLSADIEDVVPFQDFYYTVNNRDIKNLMVVQYKKGQMPFFITNT